MSKLVVRPTVAAFVATVCVLGVTVSAAAATNVHSVRFAGYVGQGAPFTTAKGRLTLIRVTCPRFGYHIYPMQLRWSAVRSGLEPVVEVEVAGTTVCDNGSPSALALVGEGDERGTQVKSLDVQTGDDITAEMSYNPSTRVVALKAANPRTGQVTKVTATLTGTHSFVWATWGLYGDPPFPSFTTIPFTGLSVNGSPAETFFPSITGYDYYRGSKLLVRAKPWNDAGRGFRLAFVASS